MVRSDREEALLAAGRSKENLDVREEVKKQLWLAGPMIAGGLLRYVIQMISVMYVGHLGELPLAGASMANSFATVTGFSLLTCWVIWNEWNARTFRQREQSPQQLLYTIRDNALEYVSAGYRGLAPIFQLL